MEATNSQETLEESVKAANFTPDEVIAITKVLNLILQNRPQKKN